MAPQENRKSQSDKVLSILERFSEKLGPFANSALNPTTTTLVGEPFPFSRRLLIPSGTRLSKEQLCTMAKLYSEDAKFAERLLAALNDNPKVKPDPPRWQALHRCAVRELIEEYEEIGVS